MVLLESLQPRRLHLLPTTLHIHETILIISQSFSFKVAFLRRNFLIIVLTNKSTKFSHLRDFRSMPVYIQNRTQQSSHKTIFQTEYFTRKKTRYFLLTLAAIQNRSTYNNSSRTRKKQREHVTMRFKF